MAVVLQILKIVGWILLGLLALLLILSLFWVHLLVSFQGGELTVKLRYLFLRFTLLPKKKENSLEESTAAPKQESALPEAAQTPATVASEVPKPKPVSAAPTAAPKKKEKPAKEKPVDTTDAMGIRDTWEKVKMLLASATPPLKRLLRHLRIRDFTIIWNVFSDDAARVGMYSGLAWSVIGDIMRVLNALFQKYMSYGEVTVQPCFNREDAREERFGCEVLARPIIIILIAIQFGILYLRNRKRFKRERENVS